MSVDMRKAKNKALARELTLHGSLTLAQLTIRDLKRRIRLARRHVAREFAGPDEVVATRLRRLYDLLDLRRQLPKRGVR